MFSFNFFVLFLGKKDKTKTEYIPQLSFLDTGKDTFNMILSEVCEYKIWKIASPGKEAAKLAEIMKQLSFPQMMTLLIILWLLCMILLI